jgi:ribosome assembly protein RRB1
LETQPHAPELAEPPFFFTAMSKRSATELLTPAATAGQPFAKASGSGSKRENVTPDDMGEFEDAWEDEIESDEEVIDAEATEDADGLFLL